MKTQPEKGTTYREVLRALNESQQREKKLAEALRSCLKITDKYANDDPYEDSITDAVRELLAEKPAIIHCELGFVEGITTAKAEQLDFELEVDFSKGVECHIKEKNFFFHLIDKIKKLWA